MGHGPESLFAGDRYGLHLLPPRAAHAESRGRGGRFGIRDTEQEHPAVRADGKAPAGLLSLPLLPSFSMSDTRHPRTHTPAGSPQKPPQDRAARNRGQQAAPGQAGHVSAASAVSAQLEARAAEPSLPPPPPLLSGWDAPEHRVWEKHGPVLGFSRGFSSREQRKPRFWGFLPSTPRLWDTRNTAFRSDF